MESYGMESPEKGSLASMLDKPSRSKRPWSYQVAPRLGNSATSTSSAEFEITEEDVILARCFVFLSCSLTVAVVALPTPTAVARSGSSPAEALSPPASTNARRSASVSPPFRRSAGTEQATRSPNCPPPPWRQKR